MIKQRFETKDLKTKSRERTVIVEGGLIVKVEVQMYFMQLYFTVTYDEQKELIYNETQKVCSVYCFIGYLDNLRLLRQYGFLEYLRS